MALNEEEGSIVVGLVLSEGGELPVRTELVIVGASLRFAVEVDELENVEGADLDSFSWKDSVVGSGDRNSQTLGASCEITIQANRRKPTRGDRVAR